MGNRRERGATLIELLVALVVTLGVVVAALSIQLQGDRLRDHVESAVRIQDNARLALDRVERDLRMIGFGVPTGGQIGSLTTMWTPTIFYASSTAIGFRAEIDGGRAEIVCTPKSTNASCPRTKLRLDDIAYYQGLNCAAPDGALGGLKLVAVLNGDTWAATTCSGHSTSDKSIAVATVADNTFAAGISAAVTIEQVQLRYIASSQPPFGRLVRHVAWVNAPSSTFPLTNVTWDEVANHLTNFQIQYLNASGGVLAPSGSPAVLSAANRAAVARIVVSMQGYETLGADDEPRQFTVRSEVLVRNAS